MPGGSFYRGGRRSNWLTTLLIAMGLAVLLLGVWLFIDLQKYIVYDKDGVRLMTTADTQPAQGPLTETRVALPQVDAEIVVDPTDYSDLQPADFSGLEPLRARFVAADSVTEGTLSNFDTGGIGPYNALVLELKSSSGALAWHSRVPLAESYELNGTLDLAEHVARLKEKGVWMAAQLSCLEDGSMAARNNPLALKNSAGGLYLHEGTGWLDPFNTAVRDYLTALMEDLADLGFDEIVLTGLYIPAEPDLQFSTRMTGNPDPTGAVSSLAVYLRQEADRLGLRLTVLVENDSFRETVEGTQAPSQDLAVFFKVFDRLAYAWDFGGTDRRAALEQRLTGGNAGARLVPVSLGQVPGTESYILR